MHTGFIQSVFDSPCVVRVAGKESLCSLSKWGGRARLDFAPGPSLEGKVRTADNEIRLAPFERPREEHVFRRLDADRFEYDLVLLSEPETNRFSLSVDFPEGLVFYRQPDEAEATRLGLRCDPSLFGSYAVYWKERNGRFKTGKFCHIHRPLAFDARGRKKWGEVWIQNGEMILVIDESWLADAAYPVVIDPVIGTQTPGAYDTIDWFNDGNIDGFFWDNWMGVNSYTANGLIGGTCTGYLYIAYRQDPLHAKSAVYSSSGGNPATRISRGEVWMSLGSPTPAWKASPFTLSRNIEKGERFWFGFYPEFGLETHYDFGGDFRRGTIDYTDDPPNIFVQEPVSFNVLSSMYFVSPDPKSLLRTMMDTIGLKGLAGRTSVLKRIGSGGIASFGFVGRSLGSYRKRMDSFMVAETKSFVMGITRLCGSVSLIADGLIRFMAWTRRLEENILGFTVPLRSVAVFCFLASFQTIIGRVLGRFILRKDELVFVSRITRELEIGSPLV